MSSKKKYFITTNDLSYKKQLDIYEEFKNNRYQKNADFVLSQNVDFSPFGNKISFCQIINTWFRRNPQSKVRIYDNYFPESETEVKIIIKEILDKSEIHILLALCYGIKNGIYGHHNKTRSYTNLFIEPLEKQILVTYNILSSKNYGNDVLQTEIFQIHPDFLGISFFENNTAFYNIYSNKYELKLQGPIDSTCDKLITRFNATTTVVSEDWLQNIMVYFYEILENAFKWGRVDWLNNFDYYEDKIVEKSNRAFFMSFRDVTSVNNPQKSNFNLDIQLSNFIKNHFIKSGSTSFTKIMELSIIDNGIGIVQGFKRGLDIKKEKVDIIEEYNYLIEAFKFGTTSDSSAQGRLRGLGLNKVMQYIENVFVIIRTGHLHLYRDFGVLPFDVKEDFFLLDVDTENNIKNKKINKYCWAEGTLVSFIIPLSKPA